MADDGILFLRYLAIAADETTKEDEPVMEEIIVTATYRDTRLMDTPLAISAVTSADMVVKGIEDIQTLYQAIPGLSYQGTVQIGTGSKLSIRGITPIPGSVGAVGVYLDNLPITSVRQGSDTLGSLFDMERVEVLKGPQGTLVNRDNWMLSAYVRNVTEEKFVYRPGADGSTLGPPRSVGVQVNYRM